MDKYLLRIKRLMRYIHIGYMYKIDGDDFKLCHVIFGTTVDKIQKKANRFIRRNKNGVTAQM